MRKIFLALISSVLLTGTALAEEVKIGIILGFTGPIESLTPDMGAGAELAIAEVNDGGALLGGASVSGVRADSTCIDSAAAQAAAERLVTSDKVNAIMGSDELIIANSNVFSTRTGRSKNCNNAAAACTLAAGPRAMIDSPSGPGTRAKFRCVC